MKLCEGDLVAITGGSNKGSRGYVFSTSKQTVWVQLAEGPDKDKVVMKRKMTWVKKLSNDEETLLLPHRGANGNSILIAMPKGHELSKEDVKVFFEEKMDSAADNALILPLSRNCLLHFESTDTVKALLSKKVVMINGSQCRIGLHYGAQAPLSKTTRDNENGADRATFRQKAKRKTPEKPNSRAAALKGTGNKKRRID